MSSISFESQGQLEKLIVESIPKDALMALEDAYRDGDKKGREHGARFAFGHRRSAGWAAAGFKDTLLRCEMKPEVVHGEKKDIQPRVQARGGQAGH